jgi:hypothetical protein
MRDAIEPRPEAHREYGELYYRADAVAAILRAVARHLEGGERRAVLLLSHDIPTTMPWHDPGKDLWQQADQLCLCRALQLGLRNYSVLGAGPVRLACLLRNGAGDMRLSDREYAAGLADGVSDPGR